VARVRRANGASWPSMSPAHMQHPPLLPHAPAHTHTGTGVLPAGQGRLTAPGPQQPLGQRRGPSAPCACRRAGACAQGAGAATCGAWERPLQFIVGVRIDARLSPFLGQHIAAKASETDDGKKGLKRAHVAAPMRPSPCLHHPGFAGPTVEAHPHATVPCMQPRCSLQWEHCMPTFCTPQRLPTCYGDVGGVCQEVGLGQQRNAPCIDKQRPAVHQFPC